MCLYLQTYAQTAATLSQVVVQGNKFTFADGTPVVFRGLNASDPDRLAKAGKWEKRYFEEMKKWGANLVRLPVHPTAWRSRGKEEYLKMLDKGVAWAGELGMYVIIDWHSIGNLKTEMYQSPMYETTLKETYEFWRTMSDHYKGNTTVAFFELFNEPTVMEGKLGSCSWEEWKAMMEEAILIVRANGAQAIPLVAGFNWAYDLTEVASNPINAEGIAYVSHPYPMKREKPWEDKWTRDWGFVADTYPLVLTEIGFCGPDERGAHVPVISDESYGDAITRYSNERGISYVVWVFDPQWSPMLIQDWNYTPTRQGRYFKSAMQKFAAGKK
ncbi:glycoside hydrolase family 5 [Flammeovirgaceae bacterium 311]|nr:glycoside hydrolase family 5 [Flammeovirgaceae bacterium 311]